MAEVYSTKENVIDKTGRRYGMLTVVSAAERVSGRARWNCLCDCGNTTVVAGGNLTCGIIKSCGCLRGKKKITHGCSIGRVRTRAYRSWDSMRQRCYNSNIRGYEYYGGRGISVCEQWRHSFECFLRDMGDCPKGMTIDRYPDKNGNYEPGNCRWATSGQQNNNKRSNVLVTAFGKTQSVAEWSVELSLDYDVIYQRIRHGWDHHKALTQVVRKMTFPAVGR